MTLPADGWATPPTALTLAGGEVHIWRAFLDIPDEQLKRLLAALSEDEQKRAARFHFRKDRDHFVAARGALRDILSRYLLIDAGAIVFQYSDYGKPDLDQNVTDSELRFNVSHSHGMALIAVTNGFNVGVDIEFPREDLSDEQIARRFFSSSEVEALLALPRSLQNKAFFTCWTRKEAYIKGIGEGLSMPLDQFDVTLVPGEPARLLQTRPDPDEAARWTLSEILPGRGFIAALAVQARKLHLKYWNWDV
jgi:4'-phosphopantetheinyl transferase